MWIAIVSFGVFVFSIVVFRFFAPPMLEPVRSFGLGQFLPLLIPSTLMGTALWLAGWILEGFAKPDH
jgi:hypothetical protein